MTKINHVLDTLKNGLEDVFENNTVLIAYRASEVINGLPEFDATVLWKQENGLWFHVNNGFHIEWDKVQNELRGEDVHVFTKQQLNNKATFRTIENKGV